ncbi:MAG TPA: AMP-binding protein [Azospira sp.]|nr:AMP-binding protein [Azospira sp.]
MNCAPVMPAAIPAVPVIAADWLPATLPDPLQLVTTAGSWRRSALLADSQALAAGLLAAGATPGDIILAPFPAPELARLFFACARAGLALFPLDPAMPPERRQALLALTGPKGRLLDALPETGQAAQELVLTPTLPAAARPALIIATSGSEGLPKAVVLTHANLMAAADASASRIPLVPGDTWLACLPLHHIGGMSILSRCARSGATAQVLPGFDPAAIAAALAEDHVTHLSLVPAMLARLLEAGVAPTGLKYVLIGGAALSASLFHRAMAAGWPLCVSYGLSECAAQVATWVHPAADQWQEGQVGPALPGFTSSLTAEGRLRLAGPQVMWGYLNPEGRPGQGLNDGALVTGDLASIGPDGSLALLGRADDMLVSGGVNVHPAEVEASLQAFPAIADLKDLAITALPDPVWGDLLVALAVGGAEQHAPLLAWCREHLPGPRRPHRILAVPQLPRNPMGKLQRSQLRPLAASAARQEPA